MNLGSHTFDARFGLAAGGVLLYKGVGFWRMKRRIENIPLSKIGSVAMGDADLSGTVKAIRRVQAAWKNRSRIDADFSMTA